MRLLKQLLAVFAVLLLLGGALTLFSYDVIKIQWVSFMGLQPSYSNQEEPLPVPERSIPVEGAAYVPGMGAPANPVAADAESVARGAQLFAINCQMCHGAKGDGKGQLAAFLANKPANLTLPVVQNKSDGALFLTITFGIEGRMPALNENLFVSERWDVVNFLRTLAAPAAP
ncbi:MAG: cytochrome c [Chloroflexota bacterium]